MRYSHLAELALEIDQITLHRHERETTSGFTRVTTEFELVGDGVAGRGEDVTYEAADHDRLHEAGLPDLTGTYTIDEFSERVGETDLFLEPPDRPVFRNYRQWGLESAALDLALRQAETDLSAVVGRQYQPLRFVTSTRLGDPPTTRRITALLEQLPGLGFKLDPTPEWDDSIVRELQSVAAIHILDLKGQYEGTMVDVPAEPAFYERILTGFPDAIIEDPAVTDETRPLFADETVRKRVSWDAPIHGLDDITSLPWEPEWLNIKPSRFGSLRSLCETLDYCDEQDIQLYGGGQFELGVGRGQLQALASLWYPDGPNDVAPRAYNDPEITDDLPTSPLSPPENPVGFRW